MSENHYAVVVGIDHYPQIGNLTAARNDAQAFIEWVSAADGGNVDPKRIERVLVNLPENPTEAEIQPTRDAIYRALRLQIEKAKLFSTKKRDTSRLYVYAAGHGIAPSERDAALLAANASQDQLGRHVSCASLLNYFQRVQLFREVVIFADCCRTANRKVSPMPVEWTDDDVDNGGVRRFLACGAIFRAQAMEEQGILADKRRGYFTRALMDGLNGAAAESKTGVVSSAELRAYISEHMRRASEREGRVTPLEPDFSDEGAGDLFFQSRPNLQKPVLHPMRLRVRHAPPPAALLISSARAPTHTTRVPGQGNEFTCNLPLGFYEAVAEGQPPQAAGKEWLFKVIEGGGNHEF